jgi:preprotein translocase subunit SecG
VQRTADFLEKGTWTLASVLMVLCLVSAGAQDSGPKATDLDAPIEEVTPGEQVDAGTVTADTTAIAPPVNP